ncbi:MAG: Fe(2+)-trafficking protein [Phycisphaerales bacterium]|jgi:Fe-S cluster biosynthesis and repair protein YggX|nr:Fe(2+)-trafficking protein [Phycisphaerales bacterium]
MDLDTRIAQFEKMAREDPDNDMAHFSLAGAYNQAGRFAESAAAYQRTIDLNPTFSKAYQLAGAALMACQRTDDAARVLTKGYTVAAQRGDLMPKKAIGDLLEKLGAPLPEVAPARAPGPAPDGSFVCRRTGKAGTQLARPPFRGNLGAWIHANISAETWDDWIRQGTKVINELRLDLSREGDAETYDRHMREYLGIDEEMYREITAARAH